MGLPGVPLHVPLIHAPVDQVAEHDLAAAGRSPEEERRTPPRPAPDNPAAIVVLSGSNGTPRSSRDGRLNSFFLGVGVVGVLIEDPSGPYATRIVAKGTPCGAGFVEITQIGMFGICPKTRYPGVLAHLTTASLDEELAIGRSGVGHAARHALHR